MFPVVPLLFLAYAALYAFAAPLPSTTDIKVRNPLHLVELDVRDAIAAASASPAAVEVAKTQPVAEAAPVKKARKAKRDYTELAGPTAMAGQAPTLEGGASTLNTGEGQGFFWRCVGGSC